MAFVRTLYSFYICASNGKIYKLITLNEDASKNRLHVDRKWQEHWV